jgi:nitroimidazol reductase NimA-like FMN-containing flavoprotein (pyridoxamine 5'-phosphate oxidase superfamily)
MGTPTGPATERVRVRRAPARAVYDAETVHAVLDAGSVCHLGITVDEQPYVIPTIYGRDGDVVYVHGSAASRTLRHLATAARVCVAVTLVDALVLARSAFHHSLNYRSVVVLGTAELIEDPAQKEHALRVVTEHLLPGRWDHVRAPNQRELRATSVLRLPLDESSAKIRDEGVNDDPEDLALDVWAGLVPLTVAPGAPVPDPRLAAGAEVPDHVRAWVPG